MGYLGNTPGESFISFAKQVFTIVNSQTAYTLDFAVVDENELRLVINNVVQEPGSGKAYTASGTTLTLSAALTNGTDEMYCVFLGKARETVTVPTITRDKLNLISDASNPSLIAKGTSGVSEGYIQLNCAENSHGIKLKSPPHSAGQSYTLTFPSSITNNTFLKTDGSGNLSFASAGGTNTPSFYSQMSANQSYSSSGAIVKVQFDTELWDTDSDYDHSTNYRFTPSEAGKYFVHGIVYSATFANASMAGGAVYIKKNGGNYQGSTGNSSHNTPDFQAVGIPFGIAVDMNGSSDYIECFVQLTFSSGTCNIQHDNNGKASYFGAYKLIGV